MPLTVTSISVLNSTANTATYTPAGFTPAANRLVVMWAKASLPAAGGVNDPTLSTNPLGLTKVASVRTTQTNTNDIWVACYVALSGSAPPVSTPVLDFSSSGANMSGCQIDTWEVNGADITGTALAAIVQSPTNSATGATTLSITLATEGHPENRFAAAFYHSNINATTPRSNWVEVTDQTVGSPNTYFETAYRSSAVDTAASASWTTAAATAGVAIEIKMAVFPTLMMAPYRAA